MFNLQFVGTALGLKKGKNEKTPNITLTLKFHILSFSISNSLKVLYFSSLIIEKIFQEIAGYKLSSPIRPKICEFLWKFIILQFYKFYKQMHCCIKDIYKAISFTSCSYEWFYIFTFNLNTPCSSSPSWQNYFYWRETELITWRWLQFDLHPALPNHPVIQGVVNFCSLPLSIKGVILKSDFL